MKLFKHVYFFSAFCVLSLAATLITGCGEKEAARQSTPPMVETTPSAAAPPSAVPIQTVTPAAGLTEVETALKTHNYDKATDALLVLQEQKGLSDQEAATVQSQMRRLQSDLANAMASGDPKAQAVAAKLRRAAPAR